MQFLRLIRWLIGAVIFQFLTVGISKATPISYSISTINPLGSNDTIVYGVNDSGQLVGYFRDSTGAHGFLLSGSTLTPIDFPGADATEVYGINNAGALVGTYIVGGVLHGFKQEGGIFTQLSIPGAISVQPFGISDNDVIVGSYQSAPGGSHGFRLEGGSLVTIDVPGAAFNQPYGINDTGEISGNYSEASAPSISRTHGFTYAINLFSFFDAPGSNIGADVYTIAHGLNDLGQIVGNHIDSVGEHVFVNTAGDFNLLNVTGALCVRGFDINNVGQVVGAYGNCSSPGWNGFVATPIQDPHHVPESSSLALVGAGLLALGLARFLLVIPPIERKP